MHFAHTSVTHPDLRLPLTAQKAACRAACNATRKAALVAALTLAALAAAPLLAQSAPSPQPLVTAAIEDGQRVPLPGHISPMIAHAQDLGPADSNLPTGRLYLVLRRGPAQEAALKAAIEALHDPASPSFHHWLTPAQFAAQWGAADADLAAVTEWLEAQGFAVAGPNQAHTLVEFSGTAGTLRRAFRTTLHRYRLPEAAAQGQSSATGPNSAAGQMHLAVNAEPSIPAALAPVVAGISRLDDFHAQPLVKAGPRGLYDPVLRRAVPQPVAQSLPPSGLSQAQPRFTSTANGDFLYVGPADAATIYDTPNHALNAAYSGTTYDGTGTTIGIVGESAISLTSNANYRSLFGLPAKAINVIVAGGVNPGETMDNAEVEAYLDTEVANALAPGATIDYYVAQSTYLDDAITLASVAAIDDNKVDILSVSFGLCEGFAGAGGNAIVSSIWEQAAAQGITVAVASGDNGAADCDAGSTLSYVQYGRQVNGLASTPYNLAVGGTAFVGLAGPDGSGSAFANYASTTNSPGTHESALGYIPESAWNDSLANFPPLTLSSNQSDGLIIGGGGGVSGCTQLITTSSSVQCSGGYAKPSWQFIAGVPDDQHRDLPDISLLADNGFYFSAWAICTNLDTDSSGNPIEDCVPGSNGLPTGSFYNSGVGGTSASTPAMAGILALIRQATGGRLGQANYVLYPLARNHPTIFHDVSVGNNSMPCQPNSIDCAKNTAGQNYLTGYNATVGYDQATGLGSLDTAAVLQNWTTAGLAASTTTLTVSPTSIQHGRAVTAAITVAPATAGMVALVADSNATQPGVAIGNYQLQASGTTGNLSITTLPGGSYNLTASFEGSATEASSASTPVAVTVTAEPSTTLLNDNATDPVTGNPVVGAPQYGDLVRFFAQPYGNNSPVVNGTVNPDGIPTGTVSVSANGVALGAPYLGVQGVAVTNPAILAPGAQVVTASYSGDRSFEPSAASITLAVARAATTLALTSNATSYKSGAITYTATLTTHSVGIAPTGLVKLISNGVVFAQGTISGTGPTSSAAAGGSVVITSAAELPGINAVTASYVGDTNYAPSSSNALTITGKSTFSIANVSGTLSSQNSTDALVVAVKSLGSYAGTVKLSCRLASSTATSRTPAECAMDPGQVTLTANANAQPLILIYGVGTRLPPGATALNRGLTLFGSGATAVAACLLFAIPARRRAWRRMLGLVLLLAAVSGVTACGYHAQFISAGTYTFTVTGVDSKDATNINTGTVTIIVP